jgi:hypothetical protein
MGSPSQTAFICFCILNCGLKRVGKMWICLLVWQHLEGEEFTRELEKERKCECVCVCDWTQLLYSFLIWCNECNINTYTHTFTHTHARTLITHHAGEWSGTPTLTKPRTPHVPLTFLFGGCGGFFADSFSSLVWVQKEKKDG